MGFLSSFNLNLCLSKVYSIFQNTTMNSYHYSTQHSYFSMNSLSILKYFPSFLKNIVSIHFLKIFYEIGLLPIFSRLIKLTFLNCWTSYSLRFWTIWMRCFTFLQQLQEINWFWKDTCLIFQLWILILVGKQYMYLY